MERKEPKSKFEVIEAARTALDEIMAKQITKINLLVKDPKRDEAEDFLKLLHITKLLLMMAQ